MQQKLLKPSVHRDKEIEIPFQISDLEYITQQILVILSCWAITFLLDDMHSLQTELGCTNDVMFNVSWSILKLLYHRDILKKIRELKRTQEQELWLSVIQ